jgi:hypothetical protein
VTGGITTGGVTTGGVTTGGVTTGGVTTGGVTGVVGVVDPPADEIGVSIADWPPVVVLGVGV